MKVTGYMLHHTMAGLVTDQKPSVFLGVPSDEQIAKVRGRLEAVHGERHPNPAVPPYAVRVVEVVVDIPDGFEAKALSEEDLEEAPRDVPGPVGVPGTGEAILVTRIAGVGVVG